MRQSARDVKDVIGAGKWRLCLMVAGVAAMAVPLSASATLGGDGASVLADQSALHATMAVKAEAGYTDYALTQPNGVVVHEFVNPSSHVFEVTWSGKGRRPDMEQILGTYATRFHGTTKVSRPVNRHADRVETDLEVHSVVRNRYFFGTAHVPALMPENMSAPIRVPAEVK
jgi:hypothetical protein